MAWDGRVPVNFETGGIGHEVHDTHESQDALARRWAQDLAEVGHNRRSGHQYWAEVKPFRASLKLVRIHKCGTSFYAEYQCRKGASYPIMATDLEELLKDVTITGGWTADYLWAPVKRGTVFGIRRVG